MRYSGYNEQSAAHFYRPIYASIVNSTGQLQSQQFGERKVHQNLHVSELIIEVLLNHHFCFHSNHDTEKVSCLHKKMYLFMV